MNEKFLPIGTVVLLKDGEKKIMITSYLVFPSEVKDGMVMYDYGGCIFPEGILDSKYFIGFNHVDIEKVIHLGLIDEEQKNLNEMLIGHCEEIKQQVLSQNE